MPNLSAIKPTGVAGLTRPTGPNFQADTCTLPVRSILGGVNVVPMIVNGSGGGGTSDGKLNDLIATINTLPVDRAFLWTHFHGSGIITRRSLKCVSH